jgi:hypothetical protein
MGLAGSLLKGVMSYRKQILSMQQDFLLFKTAMEKDMMSMKSSFEKDIISIKSNCSERLTWMRNLQDGLVKMNLNIVAIGTMMKMRKDEFHHLNPQ